MKNYEEISETIEVVPEVIERVATWEGIGTDVTGNKTLSDVLIASGLDYDVVKIPVQLPDGTVIPNRFATVRPDSNGGLRTYDVVSDKFEVVQNRDAFDFVNYMGDEVIFEKAGETANGMVYIIGRLPEVNILGDKFIPHVIFRNGFSGKVKITAAICPLRFVCQNQFAMSFKNTSNTVNVRHLSNAESKMLEAREILKSSADFMMELNDRANRYALTNISGSKFEQIVNMMFPIPEDGSNSFKRFNMERARNEFLAAYNHDDNGNFRGTAWGLINAYTDYMTHKAPSGKSDSRFENKFINTTCKPFANSIIDIVDALSA